MKKLLTIVAFVATSHLGMAQTQPVRTVADCALSFTIAANGNSSELDNRFIGCNNWVVTWETYGATPAITLTLQSAPSNAAGTASGTYATFSGTVFQGANPSTSTSSALSVVGYAPWLRINVTGLSGTVRGSLLGCRMPCTPPANSSGGGGGGSVTVTNFQACDATDATTTSTVSFSALTGNQQIVAASGSTRIYVCALALAWDNAINFKLTTGTGANCGTGTANLTGAFVNVVNIGIGPPQLRTPASAALCINTSGSATGGGFITYVQQ